jgi:hypothetical protein
MTGRRKTMENVTLDRAAEIARALKPEEQLQLRAMIDSWQTPAPAETTPEQERQFAEHLLAIGMIDHIPEGYPEGYVDPPPIVVHGEPVSKTILRERR